MTTLSPGTAKRAAGPLRSMTPEPAGASMTYVTEPRPVVDVEHVDLFARQQLGGVDQKAVDGDAPS